MVIDGPVIVAGATSGVGVAMVAAGWRRREPDLRTVLEELGVQLPGSGPARDHHRGRSVAVGSGEGGWLTRRGVALAERLADQRGDLRDEPLVRALRLHRLATDLALLEEPLELLLVRKVGLLLLGLLVPPALAGALALLGVGLGVMMPGVAGMVLAGVLFIVPDADVRSRAARARTELRRAVCAYLELVALERAADAGATEAVERAAAISDTPAFQRIRQALTRAQLDGVPPWHGLRDLADTTGVVELGDLADIMASSGRDGTAVYTSLRARASALRTAITSAETATANARSELMVIPVAVLGLIFMALLAYPAMYRLVLHQ